MEKESHLEHKKILISMRKLGDIAKSLPSPETHKERSVEVKFAGLALKFEKIKYLGSSGKSEVRWSYNSRIVI